MSFKLSPRTDRIRGLGLAAEEGDRSRSRTDTCRLLTVCFSFFFARMNEQGGSAMQNLFRESRGQASFQQITIMHLALTLSQFVGHCDN